jgi:AcrR family transcriptional regulator
MRARAHTLSSQSPPPAEGSDRLRQPRQLRGERRVDAILDAAAGIIAQEGLGAVTVQLLADRAQTSKGSLYHFFPDLRAVLCALADRHATALTTLSREMIADADIPWAALPLADVIDRFLAPLSYLEAHPDLLALARSPEAIARSTRRLAPYRELAEHVLHRRCARLAPKQRLAAASAMVAMVDGVVGYGLRADDVNPDQMIDELRRALCAYLGALDECAAARAVRQGEQPGSALVRTDDRR